MGRYSVVILFLILPGCMSLNEALKSVKNGMLEADTTLVSLRMNMEEIKGELLPIDTLFRKAMIGAIDGLADKQTGRNLDSISNRLARNLLEHMEEVLHVLDTSRITQKLVNDVKESLFSQSTQDSINSLIEGSFKQLNLELALTTDQLISNLTSQENQSKFRDLLIGAMGDSLSMHIASSINVIIDSIRLKPLEHELLGLLSGPVRDTLQNILVGANQQIEDTGRSLLDRIRDHVIWVLWGILAVASIIIFLVYRFRRKNMRDIALLMMRQIGTASENESVEQLKKRIKSKAVKHRLEPLLNETLKKTIFCKVRHPWHVQDPTRQTGNLT